MKNVIRQKLAHSLARKPPTRRPFPQNTGPDQSFAFLQNPEALQALEQLSRQVAHYTRSTERDFLALLASRKENWGSSQETSVLRPPVEPDLKPTPEPQGSETRPGEAPPPVNRGTLADCLADSRLVLPGEDPQAYHLLAKELWSTLQPANLLQGFLTSDFILTQRRLDRVPRLQTVVLQRYAISGTGYDAGFGFAFIHDAQRCGALESLRNYEAALRRRLERRMGLLRKVCKQAWTDVIPATTTRPTPGSTCASSETPASSPTGSDAACSDTSAEKEAGEQGGNAGQSANDVLPKSE